MTAWLAVIGGIVSIVVMILRWWLSADQRNKRKKAHVRKKVEKMRKLLNSADGDAIRDELRDLLL